MVRKCFYSFQYKPDNWRASSVRNIGAIDGNKPAPDNDWETITGGGDAAIKGWITDQMKGRSCTVVLIGQSTAKRKWINHEIVKSWDEKMGVVGIRIHGLLNSNKQTSPMGDNPFDFIGYGTTGKKLSSVVNCYTPDGSNSKECYAWIQKNIGYVTEEAVKNRAGL